MDTELFERLLYRLHDAEMVFGSNHPSGSSRFCRDCRARVEYLVPVVLDYLREVGPDGVDF